jgi:hypothetical protein
MDIMDPWRSTSNQSTIDVTNQRGSKWIHTTIDVANQRASKWIHTTMDVANQRRSKWIHSTMDIMDPWRSTSNQSTMDVANQRASKWIHITMDVANQRASKWIHTRGGENKWRMHGPLISKRSRITYLGTSLPIPYLFHPPIFLYYYY